MVHCDRLNSHIMLSDCAKNSLQKSVWVNHFVELIIYVKQRRKQDERSNQHI